MEINLSDFDNGGEIDCGTHHKDLEHHKDLGYIRMYRLSIKRDSKDYIVYRHYHDNETDVVMFKGTLQECVDYTNKVAGYTDVVI